jgi:hypothetical protein
MSPRSILVGGQQRHLADLAQVEPQRVERGLHGQVELGRLRVCVLLRKRRLLVRRMLVLLPLHELDRVIDHVRVEVLDLLLGQLDFLERRDNLVVGEKPFLLTFLNELVELIDVGERDVYREQVGPRFLVLGRGVRPLHEESRCRSAPLRPPDTTTPSTGGKHFFPQVSFRANLPHGLAAAVLDRG